MSRTTGTRTGETEVFAISPELGKCYKHAEATRKTGINPNEKFYSTNTPRFVGRFIREERYGYGDGGSYFAFFQDDSTGAENSVEYSYEGNTCFIEVPCGTSSNRSTPVVPIKSKSICMTEEEYAKCNKDGDGKDAKVIDGISFEYLPREDAVKMPEDTSGKNCYSRDTIRQMIESGRRTHPVVRTPITNEWIRDNLKAGTGCTEGSQGGKKKRKSLKKKRKSKRRKSMKKKQRKTKRKGRK